METFAALDERETEAIVARPKKNPARISGAIWAARTGFLTIVFLIGGYIGIISYAYLNNEQSDYLRHYFKPYAELAQKNVRQYAQQQQETAKTLAEIIGSTFVDAGDYPLAALSGWEQTAKSLSETIGASSFAYSVLVQPDEQDEFTQFAHEYYASQGYANETISPSMWKSTSSNPDGEMEVSESSSLMAPILQHSLNPSSYLLFDTYSVPETSQVIDSILSKANQEQSEGIMTELISGEELDDIPQAIYVQPLYPANDSLTVRNYLDHRSLYLTYISSLWALCKLTFPGCTC